MSTFGLPTVENLFSRACRNYAQRPLASYNGEMLTYSQAWEQAGSMAAALSDHGVEAGDRIAILMSNRLEYIIADLACVRGGFVKVALNDMLTEKEFTHILSDSGATAVIVESQFFNTIQAITDNISAVDEIITVGNPDGDNPILFDTLLASYHDDRLSVQRSLNDPLLFQYTGGTTGNPKGAVHTNGSIATNLLAHVLELDITPREQMLLTTPLPHAAGYALWSGILRGGHAIITDRFDAQEFLQLVEKHGITWSWLVPTMIYDILDSDALSETDISSIQTLVYGGAPIARDRLEEALDAFGKVFIQLYGQSEAPNIGTTLGKDDHSVGAGKKLGSCGQPTTMVDIRIAPADDKEDVTALDSGEEGEILIQAPYVMDHYHNLPEKTATTLVDGWLRTGDIGKIDENEYVYILDRDTDMVVTGGLNVYTTNVEDTLIEHPDIKNVAVIGVPDEKWGEAVHAVVVPTINALTKQEVHAFADDKLADYKRPKQIEFRDSLPKTPYGKVDKKSLREPYWEDVDRDVA